MKKYLALVCVLAMLVVGSPMVRAGTISETGVSQSDLVKYLSNLKTMVNELKADYNLLRAQSLNRSFATGGLTSSGAVATAKTTATIPYTINGVLYSFAASSSMVIPTTAAQATPTYCYYLFSLDASGILSVTKGTDAAAALSATLPAVPAGKAPIGAALIYASATAFTMGTSNLDTSAPASTTWYNISTVNTGSSASTDVETTDLTLVNP